MDPIRFEALTRSLTAPGSRRKALAGALVGSLGVLGLAHSEDAAAKKKCPSCKKRKKGKCKPKPNGATCAGGSCLGGRCVTCNDGLKNGSETDVDCGGSCKRCGNGRSCLVANDCASGTCTGGVCVTCTPNQLCGSDARGSCRCDEPFPSGNRSAIPAPR